MAPISQTYATFVIERDYPVPVPRVWEAFADASVKATWWGGDEFVIVEKTDDFRVGGGDTELSRYGADGPLGRYASSYTDIVEHERIVFTYDMWLEDAHASTSLVTIVLVPTDSGTRLTYTEQGVHLDGVHGPGPEAAAGREEGTAGLLDQLGAALTAS